MNVTPCFNEITDPRVTGRCLHLLSDILMIGLCTYLTGGTDYSEQKDKLSMKRKLYKAALDINYLKKLLEF